MNKKLIRKMLNASGGPLKIKFTPEQIAYFENQGLPLGTNNSGVQQLRTEGVQSQLYQELEKKRKEEEIKSRMERRPVLKRKATAAEKIKGKKDEYKLESQVVGMSGADPLLSFYVGGVGLNGIGALAKTGLWNVAKYAPTTQLGNWGRGYFVGNAFKNSFNGAVPTLTSQATSLLYLPVKLNESGLTSLKFFERPTLSNTQELAGATKWERNFKPKWHVANYPGYLLKGLMKGSLLEKQLSKNGTININLLNAYFNKASQIEKEVANKVLAEKFAGLKTIDYNLFKKAVLDELITYNRKPLTKYSDYGANRLGLDSYNLPANFTDYFKLLQETFPDRFVKEGSVGLFDKKLLTSVNPWNIHDYDILFKGIRGRVNMNTFTFESPRIPAGSAKHYDASTLGHSRTYITPDEPKVLHVMESLSDWGQSHVKMMPSVQAHQIAIEKALKSGNTTAFHSFTNRFASLIRDKLTKYEQMALENINKEIESGLPSGFSTIEDLWNKKYEILKKAGNRSNIGVLGLHLHDNYLQRLLQENLRYAAENGLTKMRYPTSETAAKIEGYLKKPQKWFNQEGEEVILTSDSYDPVTFEIKPLYKETFGNFTHSSPEYSPQHQTILKKYSDFPKLFLKLFKDLQVRTVTDAKGNTWYEVDVPKGYLSREWQFKQGGTIRKMQTAAGGPIKKPIKRLKDGYRYIPDEENGGWDRISDNSMSDVFATMEFTPKKTKVGSSITRKQSAPSKTYYSAYNPDDVVKGFNALTLGGLNNLSPTQWARRIYDTGKLLNGDMTWSGYTNSWINGNNGLVSLKFSEEHPYLSAGINLVGDAAALGGITGIKKLINISKPNVNVAADIGTSVEQKMPALSLEEIEKAFNQARQWHLNRINSPGYKDRALRAGFTEEEIPSLLQLLTRLINSLKLQNKEKLFPNNFSYEDSFGKINAEYWKLPTNKGMFLGIGFYNPNMSYDEAVSKFIHEFGHGATFGLNGNETTGLSGKLSKQFPLITKAVLYNKSLFPEVTEETVKKVFPYAAENGKLGYYSKPTELLARGYEFMRDYANNWWKLKNSGNSFTNLDVMNNAANSRLNSKLFRGLTGNSGAYNFQKNALGISIPLGLGYGLYNNDNLQQLQYLKQGGKMNILEFLKNGSGIHIKKKNRGKFTSYCGGKVTDECIRKAKASGNPTLVKRATFALNARRWKHKEGGKAFVSGVSILDSNPDAYKEVKKRLKKHLEGGKTSTWLKIGTLLNSDTGKGVIGLGTQLYGTISGAKKTADFSSDYDEATKANVKAMTELQKAKNKKLAGLYATLYISLLLLQNPDNHYGELDLLQLTLKIADSLYDPLEIIDYLNLRYSEKLKLMLAILGSAGGSMNWLDFLGGTASKLLNNNSSSKTPSTSNNTPLLGKTTYLNGTSYKTFNTPTYKSFDNYVSANYFKTPGTIDSNGFLNTLLGKMDMNMKFVQSNMPNYSSLLNSSKPK